MNALTGQFAAAAVETVGLKLDYGTTPILRGVDLNLAKGQTLALLGPSGCGKTTLLRLVAGLLAPSKGSVRIDGQLVADSEGAGFVPPERRGLGMVFQDYALWPHLSIARNVAFPLEMAGVARAERDRRVAAALERVGLKGFGDRDPGALSGGQQQRVAIARAIVAEPKLVLFDEPLSNLDRELRENMVGEIAHLVATLGLTAIYVTHDQSEAFTLADQVAVMRAGEVVQLAAPDTLVGQPASPEVAEFLRLGTILPVERRGASWNIAGTQIALPTDAGEPEQGDKARVLLPPKAVMLSPATSAEIAGTVTGSQFRGEGYAASVRVADGIEIHITSEARLRVGERVGLSIVSDRLRWFPAKVL